jgi:hypothetical protein
MKTLYTDASFDWTHTDNTTENIVRGKIAVSDGKGFERIDKVAVGKVDGLKQYINVLELTAIARAVELASLMEDKPDSLAIYTDSRTAMIWAGSGKIKKCSLAHQGALDYLKKARLQFGGIVTFNFVPREGNPAGAILELELEKEKPHTI